MLTASQRKEGFVPCKSFDQGNNTISAVVVLAGCVQALLKADVIVTDRAGDPEKKHER